MKSKTIHNEKKQVIQFRITEYPMVRFLVVLVFGMISAIFCKHISCDITTIVNIGIITTASVYILLGLQSLYYKLIFIIGFHLMFGYFHPLPDELEGKIVPAYFKGTLLTLEKKTSKSLRCILQGTVAPVNYEGVISKESYRIRLLATMIGDTVPQFITVGSKIETIVQLKFPKTSTFPTELHSKQMLLAKKVDAFATISIQNIAIFDNQEWFVETELQQWRDHLELTIKKWVVPQYVPLILGMMYGNTTGIEDEDYTLLQSYGLVHILSTSGTHVVFITIIFWTLLVLIRSHLWKTIILGFLLVLFVLFTGIHISALRAAIMSFCLFILPHFNRKTQPFNLLAFSTVLIFLFDPSILFSFSFYFSTSAIVGIYLCYNNLKELFEKLLDQSKSDFIFKRLIKNNIIPAISLSISAGLLSNIIGSMVFYKFSISSLIGNTIFLLLYTFALFSSILTYIFSFFSESFAYFSGIATSFFLDVAEMGMKKLQTFVPTEMYGYSIWFVAVFLFVGFLYCSYSLHIRTFMFRFFYCCLCFPIVFGISNALPYTIPNHSIYRFEDATLLHLHQDETSATFLLNANPKTLKYSLKSMNRFLQLIEKNVTVIVPKELSSFQFDTTTYNKLFLSQKFTIDSVDKAQELRIYKEYYRQKNLFNLENKEEVHR